MRRPLLSLPFVLALCLAARVGSAECPDTEPTACGRFHFDAGTSAFERGDFAGALASFRAALAQRPHPVIRFNLALALSRLGRPTAALVELGSVLRDPESDAPLKERAERERRSAEQAQARVAFKLADPARESVELDGAGVDLSAQQELLLDPGSHAVRVISNSSIVLDQELELGPGERVELRVGQRSRRIDVVVVPETATTRAVVADQPSASGPRATLPPGWFYAGLGATAVLSGLTLWSGLDTRRAYSDYQRDLPVLTQSEADARVSDGHARELRTNLLLTGSLLCGAGSAVLGVWFVDFSGAPRTALGFAPGRVSLSGSF